jgi:hypothetical protein
MSYIQPNTDIYILSNIPLNKSYEHTVYYKDKQTQAQEFIKYKKHHLTNYSYQRALIGTLKVELPYEQLIDCNYMMFKNTNFENKWFYAFITGIGYVSNNVTAVYYELDVMQTWCYDYSFMSTFVERQHSTEDKLFGNTQPEGLELGSEYSMIKGQTHFCSKPVGYCVLASGTVSTSLKAWTGIITGVYTGLKVYYTSSESDIYNLIQAFINEGHEDEIVAFYQCPTIDENHIGEVQSETVKFEMKHEQGGGYVPRNNKLYCYPFTRLEIYNTLGTATDLKFDQFGSSGHDYAEFVLDRVIFPTANYTITPLNYRNYVKDYSNTLVYGSFPTCAFAGDAFKSWWAQNKNSYLASINAIQNTYDTNVAIAQNSYQMASNSAQASSTMASNSANTSLANATASTNTALAVNESNRQYGQVSNLANGASSVIGSALSGNIGGVVSGAVNTGLSIYGTELSAQNTANTLNTSLSNASNSTSTALTNAQISYDTSMKNAVLSQQSSTLSALNTYQNATASAVAKKQDIMHLPNSAHGNAICDGMNYARNTAGFILRQFGLTSENAKRIDQYFDKYGYAWNKVYVPARQNRKHWSYLKTVGCNIKGNMNQADLITIKGIYDNGITTWNNLEEVGNYSLDNTI